MGKVGTGMFSRMNYQVQRGMKELYSIRSLTIIEWEEIKKFFGYCCAYCGTKDTGDSRNGLVPDHLISAAEHGDYVVGNAIAACHNCNDRRGKKHWEKWLEYNFPDTSKIRIKKINEYRELYPYSAPGGANSRLTESELLEYNSILNDWEGIWSRAVQLRNQINLRKKSKL
jgi:hypothetical protein